MLVQPIEPLTKPFSSIGMNRQGPFPLSNVCNVVGVKIIMKPFPLSATRNGWVAITSNYLTRIHCAENMPFTVFILLLHGAPAGIIKDRGTPFTTRLMEEVMRLKDMSHRKKSAYHPLANGLRERVNEDLADRLSVHVDVEFKTCDASLPHVTFAYNAVVQEKTEPTAFPLVQGRESTTMLDAMVSRHFRDDNDDDDTAATFRRPGQARHLARPRMNQQQSTYVSRYDLGHRRTHFHPSFLYGFPRPTAVENPERNSSSCTSDRCFKRQISLVDLELVPDSDY